MVGERNVADEATLTGRGVQDVVGERFGADAAVVGESGVRDMEDAPIEDSVRDAEDNIEQRLNSRFRG